MTPIRNVSDNERRLQAEVDALKADALRYRWLKDFKFKHNGHCLYLAGPVLFETSLDDEVDAAMKEGAK